MTAGTSFRPGNSDFDFCWDLILRTRPNFAVSYPYAAPEYSNRLVVLYALFASLEELFCRVSDEQVARSKLAWWQSQLLGQEYETSDHPVTRQLRQTCAITEAGLKQVGNVLGAISQRMESNIIADEAALKSLCVLVALGQMKLEMSLQGAVPSSSPAIDSACAVMGLTQLLRESRRSLNPGYGWVPLTVLAQLGVNRTDLARDRDSDTIRELLSLLSTLGLNWLPGGGDMCKHPLLLASLPGALVGRHWLIQLRLCVRLLQKLPGKAAARADQLFFQNGAGYAWCAWRCARALGRQGL